MPKVDLDQLITHFKLDAVREVLHRTMRPCVLLRHMDGPTTEPLPIGVAKLGGAPDIRPGFEFSWPTGAFTGEPAPMLLQLPLEQLHAAAVGPMPLPDKGFLYLFWADEGMAVYDPDATPSNVERFPLPKWAGDDSGEIDPTVSAQVELVGAWDIIVVFPMELVDAGVEMEYFAMMKYCTPDTEDIHFPPEDGSPAREGVPADAEVIGAFNPSATPPENGRLKFQDWNGELNLDSPKGVPGLWSHQIGGFPCSQQFDDFADAGTFIALINSDEDMGWCIADVGRINFFSPKGNCAFGDFSDVQSRGESC